MTGAAAGEWAGDDPAAGTATRGPLTLGQRRLWFLTRLHPGSSEYHMPQVTRLRGPLDVAALADALHDVVRRHGILRTRFPVAADGEPVQEVLDGWRPPVELLDLEGATGAAPARAEGPDLDGPAAVDGAVPAGADGTDGADLGEPARLADVSALVAGRVNAPFEITEAPPIRASVLRLGPDDHVLCIVLHHLLADDWSLGVLFRELSAGYAARLAGVPADLPPLPMQYLDHARADRRRLAAGREESWRYWIGELAGAEPLDLVTDAPRPPAMTTAGAFAGHRLPPGLAEDVRGLCRVGRTTPFMTLLAAYLALLGLYTGQSQIRVGSPVSSRDRAELEPLIGFFLTTVVLRGDLTADPTFRELLSRVKATAVGAYGHLDAPFEELISHLALRREPDRNPLFDTMFMVHGTQADELRLAGLVAGPFDPGHQQAKFDLVVEVHTGDDGWRLQANYRPELFEPATITLLLRRFEGLLRCAAQTPDAPLSTLYDRLAAAEPDPSANPAGPASDAPAPDDPAHIDSGPGAPAHIDSGPGAPAHIDSGPGEPAPGEPARVEPPSAGLVELLTAAATAYPETAAVSGVDGALSYAELHRRADRLARLLRRRGARRDHLVAVCLDPGPDLVVALLAVLTAGAAYLPLDPGHPRRRLAYLLADGGAELLVTTSRLRDRLDPAGCEVVDLDLVDLDLVGPDRLGRAEEPSTRPSGAEPSTVGRPGGEPGTRRPDTASDPLAYAIHTSGSTGQPKAVGVPLTALAARVRWMVEAYRIGPGDRVLQFSSASFDTFGEETYPALVGGATLVVPPSRAELPDFLATPAGQELTVLDLPTSYWHELVADLAGIAWPARLRLLILGGEQVRPDALGRWFEAFGDRVEVFNTYGPTEATIIATAHRLTPADATGRPPIGRPLPGTTAHVHRPGGGPVPVGVPGELLLGGAGLARGYLGRPELTAQRFVEYDGGRRYRTGDRVRWRPDGVLEFLGRLDDQLKVRGHRVEPGEVEAAIVAHPDVRHAVVTADGDARLVAHLVPEPGATAPSPAQLRAHLSELLPPHLHPDAYGVLAALPLTPNGKVDRRALPAPTSVAPAPGGTPVAPRTDAERLVGQVWTEVLGVERVGVHDDFFELGGHSLLATRMAARLRGVAGVTVPLHTIFRRSTVAELAEAVEDLLIAEIEQLDEEEVANLLAIDGVTTRSPDG
ncbi:amino acid adenylation domain-containing protein [Plantactinospora sp. B6F1]|uniref:amino acid adenylation domain-containing protein n=1 Tax=Plantactinospora sp. B6F1 TaxID=3158971 RepID=UPI0032D98FF0